MGITLQLILAGVAALATASAQTTITISPATAQVHLGTFYQFSAHVTGVTNTTVGWTVALPAGATGSPGTISAGGRYTPPSAMPSVNSVIVTAASLATPTATASAQVTLNNPFPTVASTIPASLPTGSSSLTLTINGSGFVSGAQVRFGGVGVATTYVSATRLTAAVETGGYTAGTRVPVAVTNPDPGSATSTDAVTAEVGSTDGPPVITATVAARFLNQAAFGPDAATVAHVESIGLEGYIKEQLTVPISPYPDPSRTGFGLGQVQARFFANAVEGRDQLRQRVAFAMGEMFVVSAITENTPAQTVPYLQILQKDAFVNFRTLMEDVTLSPTMGQYLNMANNDKADAATDTRANENYARELMQLFTIGLFELKPDGTLELDGSGNPIPTYDETTIQNFAKVYTGWTYPTKPGATLKKHNPAYFVGPMVVYEPNHDTTSKTLLNGVVLPAGQTAAQDLKPALDNIFSHPNVGPFVSKQLIQHLVTSNPSPQYVSRIAAVFNNNGSGVRGDMAAVVSAILLDSEARAGDNGPQPAPPPDPSGHLREPVFVVASIMRGLGAAVNDTNSLAGLATNLGQQLFYPPSVFNYFAPSYMIPAAFTPSLTLLGPEFQLQSPSGAVARYNTVDEIVYGNLGGGAVIDFTPFSSLGNTPQSVADLIAQRFFYGLMPATVNTELLRAMNVVTGSTVAAEKARAQAGLYVALSSSFYTVEH
jgi:uncharacterized protein (DUF1800 family)